ncbi:hypothetical protein [Janibacter melonis]|uniref:hypothetical protein n=1 Tax=Janibacter melonis TaxID=262209 RepID=UPI00177EEF78
MSDEDRIDPSRVALAWGFEIARGDLDPDAMVVVDGLTPTEQRLVRELVMLELDVNVTARQAIAAEYAPALLYLRSVAGPTVDHAVAVASLTPTQELIYSALLPSPPQGPGVGA